MLHRFVLLLLALIVFGGESKAGLSNDLSVIYIGNSITYGAQHKDPSKTAPPIVVTKMLSKKLKTEVLGINCGVSGATTYDFLPSEGKCFPKVEKSVKEIQAKTDAPIIFSIMLGTNDSASSGTNGAPVSNDNYKKNLLVMIDRLREMAPNAIFVLHRPIWYSPNTYNGAMYLKKGLERLKDYQFVLQEIVKENRDVKIGDEQAYSFFEKNYKKYCCAEDGNAGTFYLHPNEKGAVKLAEYWYKAIIRAISLNK